MAILDRERNVIVIRVVYDGPPEAGKTTSLRALAGSLGQPLHSPAEEYGRTLYFDWMDYTAGRFEGYQIRSQIVSVPGQRELDQRRKHLLAGADVVVFVGDSSRARFAETLERLRDLTRFVARSPVPQIGVIFQANKRDLPDALPMDEIRQRVRELGPNVGSVESVASDGAGIREAFVFSVRLALDRVREQLHTQTLPSGRPEIDSSDALMQQMRACVDAPNTTSSQSAPKEATVEATTQPVRPTDTDASVTREAAAPTPTASPTPSATSATQGQALQVMRQVIEENATPTHHAPWRDVSVSVAEDERPRSPDASAPSGAIWPPVEGRVILHEAASSRMTTHRLRNGGWAAGLGNGWRIFSGADTVYADLEAGRATLIRLARLHVACSGLLSVSRCIVLAATGQSTWRLWQIVRAERSLRERLETLERCSVDDAAARVLEAATVLCEMGTRLRHAPCNLPCTVDTVGYGDRGAMYVGLMPMEPSEAPGDITRTIGSELGAIVYNALHDRRADVFDAISRTHRRNATSTQNIRMLDDVLGQMASM